MGAGHMCCRLNPRPPSTPAPPCERGEKELHHTSTRPGRWAARVKRAVTEIGESGEWPNIDPHSYVMARFTRATHLWAQSIECGTCCKD